MPITMKLMIVLMSLLAVVFVITGLGLHMVLKQVYKIRK